MINIAYDFYLRYRFKPPYGFRPALAVRLAVSRSYLDTEALVDSGADYSVFDAEFAESLGLTLTDGRMINLFGLDGKLSPGYLHRVAIRILDVSPDWPSIRGAVVFRQNHPPEVGNLLGRHDFFRAIRLGFEERETRLYLGR